MVHLPPHRSGPEHLLSRLGGHFRRRTLTRPPRGTWVALTFIGVSRDTVPGLSDGGLGQCDSAAAAAAAARARARCPGLY
eukprot:SAG31_NODE_3736_length_3944_cov_1.151120_5_plen_80_part_00